MHATGSMKWFNALLIAALAFALGGCATDQLPSTPYKGNAVWNIASDRDVPSRARSTAPAGHA